MEDFDARPRWTAWLGLVLVGLVAITIGLGQRGTVVERQDALDAYQRCVAKTAPPEQCRLARLVGMGDSRYVGPINYKVLIELGYESVGELEAALADIKRVSTIFLVGGSLLLIAGVGGTLICVVRRHPTRAEDWKS